MMDVIAVDKVNELGRTLYFLFIFGDKYSPYICPGRRNLSDTTTSNFYDCNIFLNSLL